MIGALGIVPDWFFGIDIALELLFAIVTLLVSVNAFKAFRITRDAQLRLFGTAFALLSGSYALQSVFNFLILFGGSDMMSMMRWMMSVSWLPPLLIIGYVVLSITGFVTLAYTTLSQKNRDAYALLLLMALLAVLLSANVLFMYYLISSVLLGFITIQYVAKYLSKQQTRTLLVLVAFVFLLFGKVHFIFSINHGTYYILGHILELVAYMLLLANLARVMRAT
jgi:hypothetical protein